MPRTAKQLAHELVPHLEVLRNVLYVFENAPVGVHSTLIEAAKSSVDGMITLVRRELESDIVR
jgi:hypothetical protein